MCMTSERLTEEEGYDIRKYYACLLASWEGEGDNQPFVYYCDFVLHLWNHFFRWYGLSWYFPNSHK